MADMTKAERRANEIQEEIRTLIKEYSALNIEGDLEYRPAAVVLMSHPAPSEGKTKAKVLDLMTGDPFVIGRIAGTSEVADALIRYRHAFEQASQIRGSMK